MRKDFDMGPKAARGLGRVTVALAFAAAAVLGTATTAVADNPLRATMAEEVTVQTSTGPMGTYLTDGQGRALYLFVADTSAKSTCSGECAVAWPPLVTTGAPKAGAGVAADKLSTVARDDGSMQVLYNGHPLYYFIKDTAPGQTTGQGVNGFGALWWLVSPTGDAIT
ncbi:lipoprotein [Catellatospora paridis]